MMWCGVGVISLWSCCIETILLSYFIWTKTTMGKAGHYFYTQKQLLHFLVEVNNEQQWIHFRPQKVNDFWLTLIRSDPSINKKFNLYLYWWSILFKKSGLFRFIISRKWKLKLRQGKRNTVYGTIQLKKDKLCVLAKQTLLYELFIVGYGWAR